MRKTTLDKAIIAAAKHILRHYNKSFMLLDSDTRIREYVFTRQAIYYILRKNTKLSFASIANNGHTGSRDHATAMHGVKTVSGLILFNKDYRDLVFEAERKFLEIYVPERKEKKVTIVNYRVNRRGKVKNPRKKLVA